MVNGEDKATVAVTKLEARILFDRLLLESNDELSMSIRNLLRITLRDEPDDRHSRSAPLVVTKRQCYRVLNSIRDSFSNEVARSLADKVMDALLEIETRASVDEFLQGTPVLAEAPFDRPFRDVGHNLRSRDVERGASGEAQAS